MPHLLPLRYNVRLTSGCVSMSDRMRHPTPWAILALCLLLSGCASDAPTPTEQAAIARAERFHRAVAPAVLSASSVDELLPRMSRRLTAAAKDLWRERTGAEPPAWLTAADLRFHLVDNP